MLQNVVTDEYRCMKTKQPYVQFSGHISAVTHSPRGRRKEGIVSHSYAFHLISSLLVHVGHVLSELRTTTRRRSRRTLRS